MMRLVGIDLAWGERNPDGICVFRQQGPGEPWEMEDWYLSMGQKALRHRAGRWSAEGPVWLMVDAPLLCRNRSGRRPVDAECQQLFHAHHAGPHPVNASMPNLQRALKFSRLMRGRGWQAGWDLTSEKQMIEVFPHPALVRYFNLKKTFKYKKGAVEERRKEFNRLQGRLRSYLEKHLPEVAQTAADYGLLREPWQKPVEDQVDALICALVGWSHWTTRGAGTQVIGDDRSGFILLPRRSGFINTRSSRCLRDAPHGKE